MLEARLKKLWPQLQAKKLHMAHFLSGIRLEGIRGIKNLRMRFDYPVSVIAGGNASGKSTFLFAAACAYKVPGAGSRDYVPSTLFPDYRPKEGTRSDERPEIVIEYDYLTSGDATAMRWARRKGWNRSFLGRKNATQPERVIYLRTLTNLSNPSEARGILRMSHLKTAPEEQLLTSAQIAFAQQILLFQYREVAELSGGSGKNLLFAAHQKGASYSELHMAAGERAVLRLSREITQLENALVLIDEVEASLHPWVQQLLMLHLQQLALRNDLQVIVTTHSPAVLDSVPGNARIFLERDDNTKDVRICPRYRDIVQDALYGRSRNMLNFLCEDESAESVLNGVFDVVRPELGIRSGAVRIGRDTGASEFPGHAAAFKKFGLLGNFVFVLDGDQKDSDKKQKILDQTGDMQIPVLFLPGNHAPEQWVWDCLEAKSAAFAESLKMAPDDLSQRITRLNGIYDAASDSAAEIAKNKLGDLAEGINQDAADICREVAKVASRDKSSDIQPLVEEVKDRVLAWRGD